MEWRSNRLRIILDDAEGTITAVRTRPEGFAFNVREAEDIGAIAGALAEAPRIDVEQNGMLDHPFGRFGPAAIARITSCWSGSIGVLVRVVRTLVQSLAERVEMIELTYDYRPASKGDIHQPLLRFRRVFGAENRGGYVQIRTHPYDFTVSVEGSDAQIEFRGEGEDELALVVRSTSAFHLRVSFSVLNNEKRTADTATYLVPARPERFLYLLIAMAPPILGSPLAYPSTAPLLRPCPALGYTALLDMRGPARRLFDRLLRDGPASVPTTFPYFERMRLSQFVMIWNDADAQFPIEPFIEALRALPSGRFTSLQQILLLTSDAATHDATLRLLERIGPVSVGRIEPSAPSGIAVRARLVSRDVGGCIDALTAIDEALDQIAYPAPITSRAVFRMQVGGTPLPPLRIPIDDDPLSVIAITAAARLRALRSDTPHVAGWPRPLEPTSTPARIRDIARYVLADLAAHALPDETQQGHDYATAWNSTLAALDAGTLRAERLVVATVSAINVSNFTKLLPPTLYSSEVPAPLFPFSVDEKTQQCVLNDWSRLGAAIQAYFAAVGANDFRQAQKNLPRLEKARVRFQAVLSAAIPAALVELIGRVRPEEIVNFSALPLEWLDIDGVALGYLSDIATFRSRSRHSEWDDAAEMVGTYTSVTSPNLRAHHPSMRVLLLAPTYRGRSQTRVNAYTTAAADRIEQFFATEQSKGREVEIVRPTDLSRVSVERELGRDWSMLIYTGHADRGRLVFDGFTMDAAIIPEKALVGATALLLGCDTNGALNLAGSVAGEFIRRGARGVLSTTFPLPITVATDLLDHLMHFLFDLNLRFGDVVRLTRYDALWQHMVALYTATIAVERRPHVAVISPFAAEPETYVRAWDGGMEPIKAFFGNIPEEFAQLLGGSPDEVYRRLVSRASLAGLALTFAGELRGRLFEF